MIQFKMFNRENKQLSYKELDKEVAELWGFTPQNETEYAKPKSKSEFSDTLIGEFEYWSQSNWFDTIGWHMYKGLSLQEIIEDYEKVFEQFLGKTDENGEVITLKTIIPKEYELLRTWIKKGYRVEQIKN